jgi:hypothetical protein
MTAEELAKLIHKVCNQLAPEYGGTTLDPWESLEEKQKQFAIAVAAEILTHQGLPWPKLSQQTITEVRNLMNWLEE